MADETRTIARTATRKVAAIKAQNLKVMAYDLGANFIAYETDGTYAWSTFAEGRGKLRPDPRGGYTITVHGNLWFRLIEREAGADG